MTSLAASGDGPHVVGVDRLSSCLNPLSQAAGNSLLDSQEGHHIKELVDVQIR